MTAPARKHKCRWSARELRDLRLGWSETDLPDLAAHIGRSPLAVRNMAVRLGLGGGRHGLLSITGIARRAGYSWLTVAKAIAHLGLPLRVLPAIDTRQLAPGRNRWRGLPEEHEPALVAYLLSRQMGAILLRPGLRRGPRGTWGAVMGRPPSCKRCGRKRRPHWARGLCHPCYNWLYNRGRLPLASNKEAA